MTFDLAKILESKRALRRDLAARPIAEKLALLRTPCASGNWPSDKPVSSRNGIHRRLHEAPASCRAGGKKTS